MSPTGPLLRMAENEDADVQDRMNNFLKATYKDWPNEAGASPLNAPGTFTSAYLPMTSFDGLTEQRDLVELKVTGEVPAWAAGSLYRTGPGIFKVEDTPKGTYEVSHWFDGLAQTHRFDIIPKDGGSGMRVFYTSRNQSEALVAEIKQSGTRPGFTFAQRMDPCLGMFGKSMSTFNALNYQRLKDFSLQNVSVTVQGDWPVPESAVCDVTAATKVQVAPPLVIGHQAVSLPKNVWLGTDNNTIKKIDPVSLDVVGYTMQEKLHPKLNGPLSCAHPERDPVTGDVYNFNLAFGRYATYTIFRMVAATGETELVATICRADVKPAYIHSFYLTPSFVVLCIPSTHLGMCGAKMAWTRNILDTIETFSEKNACKWLVVDRHHGKGVVASFETEAGFFFHTVNAFEEDGPEPDHVTVSCDVVDFVNHDMIFSLYCDVIRRHEGATGRFFDESRVRGTGTRLARIRFSVPRVNAASASTQTEAHITATRVFSIPAPHSGELPTINQAYAGRRHRFVYALPSRGVSTMLDAIVKTDVDTRAATLWIPPHGHSPGEAIFVARPGAVNEDDGVLLSVVLDGHKGSSYLLCLDAKTMKELGRAEMNVAVGLGFHGMHHRV